MALTIVTVAAAAIFCSDVQVEPTTPGLPGENENPRLAGGYKRSS
jgi:hypothetical protein